MRQVSYNAQNITLNYLGAYTQAHISGGQLLLCNTLTDRSVVLTGENKYLLQLLALLQDGAPDAALMEALASVHAEKQFETLLQEGLVE